MSKANTITNKEHMSTSENMIKLHVLGEDWDDAIPRVHPDIGSRRGKDEDPEVSQEKSKLGLGE